MDEQEVPENSSEEISKDKDRESDDIAPTRSETDPLASEPSDERDGESTNIDAAVEEIGTALPPEEMPTMQWSDVYAELAEYENLENGGDQDGLTSARGQQRPDQTGPLDGLEDAMNWLEQLAAGQGMPIDEMPTLVTAQPVSDEVPQEAEVSDGPSEPELIVPALDLDSDPMAWLEQLAVDQSSPLEELPSVADRLLASEIISQTEIPPNSTINDPYDVDQALSYLEQLADAQSIDLADVSFDTGQPVDSLNAALTIIDGLVLTGLAAAVAASRPETPLGEKDLSPVITEDTGPEDLTKSDQWSDLSTDMPDDPQNALDWLSTIGEESDDISMEIGEEADTLGPLADTSVPDQLDSESEPMTLDQADEGSQLDADALDEMPEDPDEAIAWMQRLATTGSQSSTTESGTSVSHEELNSSHASGSSLSHSETLVAAQAALDSDDLEQALSIYQSVLDEGDALDELVAALEDAVEDREDSPRLLRLLGDAYMQNGEIDKAISTYRKGFDHL